MIPEPSLQAEPSAPSSAHLRALQAIRNHELRLALRHFPSPLNEGKRRTVLEIGAGTGQQANIIETEGYQVFAIDLPESHYRAVRVHDVVEYDGRTIPLSDGSADIVFSSNVLEHIREIDDFLRETLRVMRADGVAVHILPSSACRLWSIPSHYIWLARRVYQRLRGEIQKDRRDAGEGMPRTPSSAKDWFGTFFPLRHGERGSTLTEAFYFSKYWWVRKFEQRGFKIIKVEPNHLFYTMANAFSDSLDLTSRAQLSRLLGSACHIYLLQRSDSRLP
ncbi:MULTISPECIES: class I SAM-dependent methyltransferase [unclassified Pseudoxanthomonas]|uniref:class I SAM-dependent methyltransferase n=1 Tax=unclassified Pseudoxanthomonas TaxID=2645906 RepID=UPI0030784BA5